MAGPFTVFDFGDPKMSPATMGGQTFKGPVNGGGGGSGGGPVPVASVLPPGYVGTAYSETITAQGGTGPYTYTVSVGSLPAGLSLSTGGIISGTPTLPLGTAAFTIKVVDSTSASGSEAFQITITTPPQSNYGFAS